MGEPSYSLPNDVQQLKQLVHSQQKQILLLSEQLRLFKHARFAPSSEKGGPDQITIFNEAEVLAAEPPPSDSEGNAEVEAEKPAQQQRGKRKPLPEQLPRIDIVHDLSEHEKQCACGCLKEQIGEDASEQLDIIPAKVQVLRHIYPKYCCPSCDDGGIQKARPLPSPIPKSNVSPGLLAYIITAKFVDALPLYRQGNIFGRMGIELSDTTMARWVIQAANLIQPLLNLMADVLMSHDILAIDETTTQVLRENGRTAQSKSFMFVRQGGPPEQPVILYHYSPSKAQTVSDSLLEGFNGYLQSDGYQVYGKFSQSHEGVTSIGCWAHARRKFKDATNAQGKVTGHAAQGLKYINELYRIEKIAADATSEQRYVLRQEKAKALLEKIHHWLENLYPKVPNKTALGKALTYLHNQWDSLVGYIDDGRLRIDNNLTENAIRPFAVGRKNWMFSTSPAGAGASAAFYSLVESAKANQLEPYGYLRHIFKELPKATTIEAFEALLPWSVDKNINSDAET